MPKRFYLTTTLPYVNADPHIGFALEIIQADIIARYRELLGEEVFFNTGTDEHGLKIYRKAQELNRGPQEYVDEFASKFKNLQNILGLSEKLNFIRTTNPEHKKSAQKFWEICQTNGFIYKKDYQVKYCVGCELEKTDSELENNKCAIHPNLEIELISEENYFFKFSSFQEKLLDLYNKNPDFVIPNSRLNEIKSFVARGLEDFSISRLKNKMPWGVAVPGDPEHVMYVWFDALVNYISCLGWPFDSAQDKPDNFVKFWPGVQFAGKDNLRQQAAMWQAMLLAAGLPNSKQIIIHGFITSAGQKMSKSLGNVIDPVKLVAEYGTDALRYYLARHVQPFEDSDFTLEKFKEAYNANLANGLGNLVSRVMKMATDNLEKPVEINWRNISDFADLTKYLNNYEYSQALDEIWKHIAKHDEYIQETKPFSLIKTDPDQAREIIAKLVQGLADLAVCLEPIMPSTSAKIKQAVQGNKMPEALFPRKE
ncbi:MAG: methionine--tRNA ligase [Patescibacteria group bacterium]